MHIDSNSNSKPYIHKKKLIAILKGDVLCKEVSASRHMLLNPLGWAVQRWVLEEAEEDGGKWVYIHDHDTEIFYWATIDDFFSKGLSFNRGYGNQQAIQIDEFQKLAKGEKPLVQA